MILLSYPVPMILSEQELSFAMLRGAIHTKIRRVSQRPLKIFAAHPQRSLACKVTVRIRTLPEYDVREVNLL